MITIQSGKMIIPEEERFVGFAGDDHSSMKQFILPQTRITDVDAVFALYLRFDDDSVTSAPLIISIVDSDTILTWDIRAENLLRPGIVMAQIKYTAGDGTVTHYSWDYFVVGASAEHGDDGSEIDVLSRSEFEERMAQAVREAREIAPYIGADGYWYVYRRQEDGYVRSISATNIEVDSAVDAVSTNPAENRAVKAYVDAADSGKVDKTQRVAGLALDGNISADDLYENMAGKINPPLVTIGITPGQPAQYGRTSDGTPVFCKGLDRWVPLAEVENVPTKTSELTNDSGFLTQHHDISGKVDKTRKIAGIDLQNDISAVSLRGALSVPSTTSQLDNTSGFITLNDVYNKVEIFRENSDPPTGFITYAYPDNCVWYNTQTKKYWTLATRAMQDGGQYNGKYIHTWRAWEIPTKTSDLTNDSGFLTQHQDVSGKMNLMELPATAADVLLLSNGQLFKCQGVYGVRDTSQNDGYKAFLTAHQDISGKENTSNKVTSLSSNSTDTQYPSAKCVNSKFQQHALAIQSVQGIVDSVAAGFADLGELYEDLTNKVTSVSAQSTDTQYPTAKCVFDSLSGKEDKTNKVTSVSAQSTDTQYPSAKCVYDLVGNIASLLAQV